MVTSLSAYRMRKRHVPEIDATMNEFTEGVQESRNAIAALLGDDRKLWLQVADPVLVRNLANALSDLAVKANQLQMMISTLEPR